MKLALSLSLLLATLAPAAAADLSEASPDYGKPAVAPLQWSGPYVGIGGGYGWGSTSHSFTSRRRQATPIPRAASAAPMPATITRWAAWSLASRRTSRRPI